jgi:hypothetical protein
MVLVWLNSVRCHRTAWPHPVEGAIQIVCPRRRGGQEGEEGVCGVCGVGWGGGNNIVKIEIIKLNKVELDF